MRILKTDETAQISIGSLMPFPPLFLAILTHQKLKVIEFFILFVAVVAWFVVPAQPGLQSKRLKCSA